MTVGPTKSIEFIYSGGDVVIVKKESPKTLLS